MPTDKEVQRLVNVAYSAFYDEFALLSTYNPGPKIINLAIALLPWHPETARWLRKWHDEGYIADGNWDHIKQLIIAAGEQAAKFIKE